MGDPWTPHRIAFGALGVLGVVLVSFAMAAAFVDILAMAGGGEPPIDLGLGFAGLMAYGGMAIMASVLAAAIHALLRRDVPDVWRVVLAAGALFVPLGGILYWFLGDTRTRKLVERMRAAA